MDATTPRRDDEPTAGQPAVPPPLVEPAQPARGSTAARVTGSPPSARADAGRMPDDGPEDPTAPDTAVEATFATEPAGSRPGEPVIPTSQPEEVQVAAPPAAPPTHPAPAVEPTRPAAEPAPPDEERTPPAVPAAQHVAAQQVAAAPAGEHTDAQPAPSTAPGQEVVYVAAPTPPKKKGNRGIGVLLAALSSILFLLLYSGVVVLVNNLQGREGSVAFLGNLTFYIPVLLFAIGFMLLAVIVNRAGWWSFVLGSFFVGVFVYLGTILVLLLSEASRLTADAAVVAVRQLLISPLVIGAGLVAREVALWVGAAISARGRRVKARNAEARAEFDR